MMQKRNRSPPCQSCRQAETNILRAWKQFPMRQHIPNSIEKMLMFGLAWHAIDLQTAAIAKWCWGKKKTRGFIIPRRVFAAFQCDKPHIGSGAYPPKGVDASTLSQRNDLSKWKTCPKWTIKSSLTCYLATLPLQKKQNENILAETDLLILS